MIPRLFTKLISSKHSSVMHNLILANPNIEVRVSSLIVPTLQTDKLRLSKFMRGDCLSYELCEYLMLCCK